MPPKEEFKQSLPSDTELLDLFHTDQEKAWDLFIEKHANFIFTNLRRTGFDHDRAMDCFVYVCEKLCEKRFRRLKTVEYAGQKGDITPWLRTVINRLSVNWLWAKNGRKRLPKPVQEMSGRDQKIFRFYFWSGQRPSQIFESLLLEQEVDLTLGDVFDSLQRIFAVLSKKKLWNLMSGLLRAHRPASLDKIDLETGFQIHAVDERPLPDNVLTKKEDSEILSTAMDKLSVRERLVTLMRYEDTLPIVDIAALLRIEPREVIRFCLRSWESLQPRFEFKLQFVFDY